MKQKFRQDAFVKCPYYHKDAEIEIRCDGLISGISSQLFKSKKKKEEHKREFCMSCWQSCEHCIAIEIKQKYWEQE